MHHPKFDGVWFLERHVGIKYIIKFENSTLRR